MKNIMMDLETFGTNPYSVIIAIGACWFDPAKQGTEAIKSTFYAAISPDKQQALGLRIDVDTVCWWMLPKQRPAYDDWLNTLHMELPDALFEFSKWLERLGTVEPYGEKPEDEILMWGNGPQFDNELLRHAYKIINEPAPWHHNNDRCFRTIKNLPGGHQLAPPYEGLHHNALIDARQQAMWLCNINQTNALGLT